MARTWSLWLFGREVLAARVERDDPEPAAQTSAISETELAEPTTEADESISFGFLA